MILRSFAESMQQVTLWLRGTITRQQVRGVSNVMLELLDGGSGSNSQAMNRERLVVQSCSRNANQMAMMRKDHNLPALGKLRQSRQDVRRAFIIRGDEYVIEHKRHVRV